MSDFSDSLDTLLHLALTHPEHAEITASEIISNFLALGPIPEQQITLSLARLVRKMNVAGKVELTEEPLADWERDLLEGDDKYSVTWYFKDRDKAIEFLEENAPAGLKSESTRISYNIPGH